MLIQATEHTIYDLIRSFALLLWVMLWPLAFGFLLSAIVRTKVSASTISRHLGSNTLLGSITSFVFGVVSSVCNYAVVGMARTLRQKGATWPNVITYMSASTNLGITMVIALYGLLGADFLTLEIATALLLTFAMYALAIALQLPKPEKPSSSNEASQQLPSVWKQTAVYFYEDIAMTRKDILVGMAVASTVGVLVPSSWWQAIFIHTSEASILAWVWNSIAGSIIAILTFGCSIGNVALAAILWWKGVSIGGVLSFTLASLLTFPMLQIYRKTYGTQVMKKIIYIMVLGIIIASVLIELLVHTSGMTFDRLANASSGGTLGHVVTLALNLLFGTLGVLAYRVGKANSSMGNMSDMGSMGDMNGMDTMHDMDNKQSMKNMDGMATDNMNMGGMATDSMNMRDIKTNSMKDSTNTPEEHSMTSRAKEYSMKRKDNS